MAWQYYWRKEVYLYVLVGLCSTISIRYQCQFYRLGAYVDK